MDTTTLEAQNYTTQRDATAASVSWWKQRYRALSRMLSTMAALAER